MARCRPGARLLPLLLAVVPARAAPPPPAPPDLRPAPAAADESLTVHGTRPRFTAAPLPGGAPPAAYGTGRDAVRDTMTGTNLSAFGNAYALGSAMGNDERSNETGGPFVAPRHP